MGVAVSVVADAVVGVDVDVCPLLCVRVSLCTLRLFAVGLISRFLMTRSNSILSVLYLIL